MIQLGTVKLPDEAITETFAILGRKGSGKTTTARVLTEGLLDSQLPVVVLDPTGAWWGLRTSADGKAAGHPVVIFGGDHADVPLEASAGELIADVVVDNRMPAVLDMDHLSKGAARTFATAFLERLYHRNREVLHVVIDEADLFAPQRGERGTERLLGAMDDLVRRGRKHGLGTTLITQRPQVLHKNVLSQVSVLITLQMMGIRDISAIDEWVSVHADDETARQLKASLPKLPVGTAWIWSPGWLGVLEQSAIQRPSTYDSSATPKPGERRAPVKRMATVDLATLGERIQATVERAAADDPAALRRRITELERQLTDLPPTVVEVPKLQPGEMQGLRDAQHQLVAAWESIQADAKTWMTRATELLVADQPSGGPAPAAAAAPAPRPLPTAPRSAAPATDPAITPARQRILAGLSELAGIGITKPDRVQLALWIGSSPRGGSYANNLGALRTAGLIDYPAGGRLELTPAGAAAAPSTVQYATVEQLHSRIEQNLPPAKWRIAKALIDAYPKTLHRESLAALIGVAAGGGSFANNLGALRTLGLIDYPGPGLVVALPVLFLDGGSDA